MQNSNFNFCRWNGELTRAFQRLWLASYGQKVDN